MIDTVIGLGQAGCAIVEKFRDYPQYTCITIDSEGTPDYKITKRRTAELYEEKTKKLIGLVKKTTDDILFVTSAGAISGASLKILQQLHDGKKQISVLYIKPELHELHGTRKLQENVLYNVFQEYARSSVFKTLFLVDNSVLCDIMGEVVLKEYRSKMNDMIVNTIHMVNVFSHSKPLLELNIDRPDTANIATIGVSQLENNNIHLFFNLDNVRQHVVYYGIPETKIENDMSLMRQIKEQAQAYKDVSYRVYSTQYDDIHAYCLAFATAIQKNNTGLKKVLTK
tara:strand:- start:18291 stop:19139 length:849 start_codon:yes stop_codon:yes gene_type:complete